MPFTPLPSQAASSVKTHLTHISSGVLSSSFPGPCFPYFIRSNNLQISTLTSNFLLLSSLHSISRNNSMRGFPRGSDSEESACSAEDLGSILGWEDPQRREWLPTPVLLPGESHGEWSLEGYSPWGRKEWGSIKHKYNPVTSLPKCSAICFLTSPPTRTLTPSSPSFRPSVSSSADRGRFSKI